MAKLQGYNPKTSEVRSPLIAGLSEIASKISGTLDVKTATMTDFPLPELYISETLRYKMYEAPLGNKLWLSSPDPVFKKNGVIITPEVDNFTIDYLGGSIVFEQGFELTASDEVTVTATYITDGSNKIDEIMSEIDKVSDVATHYKGFYSTLDALMGKYATGVDGDFAIVGEKSSLYVWNSTDGEWTNTFKEYDLEQAKSYTEQAKASAETATQQATNASTSADNAKASEDKAKESENNAKASEDNAKSSETASAESATKAEDFSENAEESATKAKLHADSAKSTADDISKANKMNCLLNWDFRNPINRNGATSYTGKSGQSTFTIDRWAIVGTGSIALSNDCINVTGACDFKQDLTNPNSLLALQNQTVTSSVVYHYSGEGAVLNIVCSYSDGSSKADSSTLVGNGNSRLGVVTFNTASTNGATLTGFAFDVIVPDGVTISLCAAKVEIGNAQTLAKMGTLIPDNVENIVGQANYETEYTSCANYAFNTNKFVGTVSAYGGSVVGSLYVNPENDTSRVVLTNDVDQSVFSNHRGNVLEIKKRSELWTDSSSNILYLKRVGETPDSANSLQNHYIKDGTNYNSVLIKTDNMNFVTNWLSTITVPVGGISSSGRITTANLVVSENNSNPGIYARHLQSNTESILENANGIFTSVIDRVNGSTDTQTELRLYTSLPLRDCFTVTAHRDGVSSYATVIHTGNMELVREWLNSQTYSANNFTVNGTLTCSNADVPVEIGKYMDFHETGGENYSVRLQSADKILYMSSPDNVLRTILNDSFISSTGSYGLRYQALVTSDQTPGENGYICWTYG